MKKDKYCMIPFMRYLEQANTQLQKIKWWIKEKCGDGMGSQYLMDTV